MKKFEISSQKCNIGWKETDHVGKIEKSIVEYESLEVLLNDRELFVDFKFSEEDPLRNSRMLASINKKGGFMMNEDCESYWHDPEPCDSYLTYGTWIEIREISEEELQEREKQKENKRNKKIEESSAKWKMLFENHEVSEEFKKILLEYEFPKKIE